MRRFGDICHIEDTLGLVGLETTALQFMKIFEYKGTHAQTWLHGHETYSLTQKPRLGGPHP